MHWFSRSKSSEDSRRNHSSSSSKSKYDKRRTKPRTRSTDPVPEPGKDDGFGTMKEHALEILLKIAKRADIEEFTLRLNNALINAFNKILIGEGKWDKDTSNEMKDKYYLPQETRGHTSQQAALG